MIIALFGIVNTLALSVYERTHELGLLRAVGTSRRQIRQIVRGEAVITAVMGSIIGIAIGVAFGVLVSRPLGSQGFVLAVPYLTLGALLVLGALAGVVAALGPARRASRVDILQALTQAESHDVAKSGGRSASGVARRTGRRRRIGTTRDDDHQACRALNQSRGRAPKQRAPSRSEAADPTTSTSRSRQTRPRPLPGSPSRTWISGASSKCVDATLVLARPGRGCALAIVESS